MPEGIRNDAGHGIKHMVRNIYKRKAAQNSLIPQAPIILPRESRSLLYCSLHVAPFVCHISPILVVLNGGHRGARYYNRWIACGEQPIDQLKISLDRCIELFINALAVFLRSPPDHKSTINLSQVNDRDGIRSLGDGGALENSNGIGETVGISKPDSSGPTNADDIDFFPK